MQAGRFTGALLALVLCAGCGTHTMGLYPSPDPSFSTYSTVRQLRADREFDASTALARLTPVAAEAQAARYASASVTPAPGASVAAFEAPPAASPAAAAPAIASNAADAPGRFVCTDGTTLDISYTLDRRTALVRVGGAAAAIEMARAEDVGLPTYVQGENTLRTMGPRVGWSTAEGGATTVTVQPGDTLSAIALRRYGSFAAVDEILRANASAITNADLIFPGQVITLPGAGGAEQSCRKLVSAERT